MTPATIKFLLVDDLDANLLALEGLLRQDDLELLKANSGPEALELLLKHDVSLALLDVQMAGMDGFELAELMRGTERTRRVPIIFLTAGAVDQQRRFRGYEAGAVDFIFKPIEPHILQSKVSIFFELAKQREALRLAAEEAQAASRAKDHFLAALSHELRTPLTPVLMCAASLQEDDRLPEDVREQLGMMRRNIELEARLIDDLLDVTRIKQGKLIIARVPTDVHELLHHTRDIIHTDKQVQVIFDLKAERTYAMADTTRLHQVFWNLLNNALKFTPDGGTVSVRSENQGHDKLAILVQDSGVGISQEALPLIFHAFEQGDAGGQHRFGGLGLGLAISKAIMEAHSGVIHAASRGSNQGATFTVILDTVDAPKALEVHSHEPAAQISGLKLLIVEDHETTRTMLARLLTRDGHQVTLAKTIAEGLSAFAEDTYEAVISDLGLPDGSGLELMRELRRLRPVPGIALSGYGMEEDIRQTREAGFFAHLIKPVSIDQLRRLLAHVPHASE